MAKRNLLNTATADIAVVPVKVESKTLESFSPTGRSSSQREAWVHAIAQKLNKSEVKTVLDEADLADQTRKRGPVAVLWSLMLLTGNTQVWSDDTQILGTWPEPGTGEKGVKKEKLTIIPPTKANALRVPEWIAVTKPSGDGTVDVSAYRQIMEDMEPEVMNKLRQVANASDSKADLSASNPYGSWSQGDRDIERGKLNSTITNGAERLRKAMAIYYKIAELHEHFSDVVTLKLDTIKEKKEDKYTGKMVLRSGTIKVVDKDNPEVSRPFDATAFLRLNVEAAKKEGGSYINIIQSGKSKRKPGGIVPTTEALSKFNLPSFESNSALMAHFMDDADKYSQLSKKLKTPDATAFLITAGDLAFKLFRMFGDPASARLTELGKKYQTEARLAADSENADTE
jgi:hypothetical protein